MTKRLTHISQILLIGWLLAWCGVAQAQNFNARDLMRAQQRGETNSLYGGNPYAQSGEEGEEQEGQQQDTTKKEKKIRKPLESYFFSDSVRALNNFKWNISRDYNRVDIAPLDTMLTDYRIDYPFYRQIGRAHV